MSLLERFEKKFVRASPEECWLWTASKYPAGYGQIRVGGNMQGAHRVSYELYIGPIPEGLFVLHRCDVRPCVNHGHLFLGTNADNVADMYLKGRQAKSWELGARGEKNGHAKLTEAEVLGIRSENGFLQRELAAIYGVSRGQIGQIRSGKSWAHL